MWPAGALSHFCGLRRCPGAKACYTQYICISRPALGNLFFFVKEKTGARSKVRTLRHERAWLNHGHQRYLEPRAALPRDGHHQKELLGLFKLWRPRKKKKNIPTTPSSSSVHSFTWSARVWPRIVKTTTQGKLGTITLKKPTIFSRFFTSSFFSYPLRANTVMITNRKLLPSDDSWWSSNCITRCHGGALCTVSASCINLNDCLNVDSKSAMLLKNYHSTWIEQVC